MRLRLAVVLALVAVLAFAAPAAAVRNGQADDGEHPYVGQLLFYVPDVPDPRFTTPGGWFNCTGTLVSPTVIVTAGHCTFGVGLNGISTTGEGAHTTAPYGNGGNDIWITFDEEANYDGFPASDPYIPDNNARYAARVAWLDDPANGWHRGTAHPHPQYNDAAFFLYDAGVVELDSAVTDLAVTKDGYGAIAPLGYLEKYRSSARNEQRFEVVGYGLEKVLPKADFGGDTRLKAEPKLNSLNGNPRDTYIILSNNTKTGGTCYGDSGGPTFDNTDSTLIVAVTSFGMSPNCTGIGGAYRLDQPDDLLFLKGFGITP